LRRTGIVTTRVPGRHERRVGGVVGDDRDLGRPGLGVRPDPPAQQPLGRGHVDVARPGHDVGRGAVLGPVGEHRDRLRAADCVHLGHAEQRAGRQDRRVRRSRQAGGRARVLALRRRGHGDRTDAGDLRRDHVHHHR